MGYIRDGHYVRTSQSDPRIIDEIVDEIKVVFEEVYGRHYTDILFNDYLSAWERNLVTHKASVRVQERRRNRD